MLSTKPFPTVIIHQNTLISEDVFEKQFVCNLDKCKGACCVEGDLGAPLEQEELAIFEEIYDKVEPYLSEEGKKAIAEQGLFIKDWEDDWSTTTIDNKECAYAIYDDKGYLKCAVEQAYLDGKIDYKKPISCHLYPIRVQKLKEYDALNYDRWDICSDACDFGEKLGVTVFSFLKEPLIRKYGKEWYESLEQAFENEK